MRLMRTHQIKAFDAGGSREIKKTRLGAEENQTQTEQHESSGAVFFPSF